MKKNYCIAGLKSLKDLPQMDCVQFTLNSRTYVSRRDTVSLLKQMEPFYKNTDVIVHGDFVYETISRFAYFTPEVQNAILNEVISIVQYANENPRIKGIIMHTDFPLRRDCYVKGVNLERIEDAYKSSLWNVEAIKTAAPHTDVLLDASIIKFYYSFKAKYSGPIGCKIYLENTVHTGPSSQGSLEHLKEFLNLYPELTDLFGICWDWEHEGAVSGKHWTLEERVDMLKSLGDCIVHMNCIPEDAPLGSGKDHHSFTTIYECSEYDSSYYLTLADWLIENNIPFVREIKEETMYRELDQFNGTSDNSTGRS